MNDAAACANACVYVCFPTYPLARQTDGLYSIECQQNQSPVEQRGDGIPPQAAINPTWRTLSSFVAFIPFKGQCKERLSFSFLFFLNMRCYCKSTRRRICKYQQQIKKKRTGKFFSHPPPLHPYPSLSYLSVAASQWFIIIGRCHHADDTQSLL